jgi:hypothetical protein
MAMDEALYLHNSVWIIRTPPQLSGRTSVFVFCSKVATQIVPQLAACGLPPCRRRTGVESTLVSNFEEGLAILFGLAKIAIVACLRGC